MSRYRMLLAATWTAVTAAAVLIAWLAVSSAVANVADPAPALIGGTRNGDAISGSTTTTVIADAATAAGSDGVPSSSDSSSDQSGQPAVDPHSASTTSGVGDPFAVDRADDSPSSSQPPTTNTASFGNEGGVVTLSCTGDAVSLVSASPRQGYTVYVGNAGPGEVEVTFKSSTHDAEIHGRCSNGTPVATVSDD